MNSTCSPAGATRMIDGYGLADAEYAIVGHGQLDRNRDRDGKISARQRWGQSWHVACHEFSAVSRTADRRALKNVKAIAVIERMDNPTAQSNPLTAEIKAAFADALSGAPGYPKIDRVPVIYSGSAGLGSRDIRPGDFVSVIEHLRSQ